jgi:hypothetical protein
MTKNQDFIQYRQHEYMIGERTKQMDASKHYLLTAMSIQSRCSEELAMTLLYIKLCCHTGYTDLPPLRRNLVSMVVKAN